MPLTLGVNAAYHESSAALVRDGEVLFAVEEERLTRVKHGKRPRVDNPDRLPERAIDLCLRSAGVALGDLDRAVYSLEPGRRRLHEEPYRVCPRQGFGTALGETAFEAALARVPSRLAPAPVQFLPHHLCHAALAFYGSPFEEAAVLVVDGIGEDATAWLGRGRGSELECLEEVPYPHSLGLLWERVALYLGFTEYDAPKVMGLAAFGEAARALPALDRVLHVNRKGFQVDPRFARFRAAGVEGLEELFGPRHRPGEPHEDPRFAAVAAALQQRTEEALLSLAHHLHRLTGLDRLAYSGGVALNCVANARLEREGPFEALYVPGASHDAGTAVGAALEASLRLGASRQPGPLTPFLGPAYDCQAGEPVQDPPLEAAQRLARGELVGWYQGRLELGPRALGHRSLLADPRRGDVRQKLNERIKHREMFRPFAASVLEEEADDWFDLPDRAPGAASCRDLMLLAYPVVPAMRELIPAVVHRDGSCRIQVVSRRSDPLYHRLLQEFHRLTSVPLVLNTSFNDSEPIVCTPEDALSTFRRSGLDVLYLGSRRV
ncbi:MAG: carbamoyltransferase C-terminal domain-containing protein, partial [Candidatus Eremiobacterota bacterium]